MPGPDGPREPVPRPATVKPNLGQGREERRRFVHRVLAALPGPDEEPVSTKDIGDAFRLGPYERSLLWASLDKLVRAGLVDRIVVDGELVRYWRRTATGQDTVRATKPRAGH